jgi:dienelactone hydrolase
MHALLTRPLDWMAIQTGSASVRRSTVVQRSPEEIGEFLRRPDFFSPALSAPPELTFADESEFRFTSPITTAWPANNTVHGRLFPCGPDWRARPSVVLLHGWNGESAYWSLFPWWARQLARAGVNAAMLELPYHSRRRPRDDGAAANFISGDVLHVATAVRQALADVRALVAWLASEGSPCVGVWGMSLGAWLSGLLACTEPRLGFAVLLSPIADIARAVRELAFCEPIRRGLAPHDVALAGFNLAAHVPKLPPERILLLKSEHDLLAPGETIEGLWQAWKRPEMWRLPHGHISVMMDLAVARRTVEWIRQRA